MKLDAAPWSAAKLRKGGKDGRVDRHRAVDGLHFAGYFAHPRTRRRRARTRLRPWQTFWVLFYAFATWATPASMREQVCKYMCPYARFQSAMFDRDTLIISYDTKRGEPRGARLRKGDPAAATQGACVDCGLCVQVCPTGIDIRKGLQYECIGCAACIDACDAMMAKIGQPAGLMRYDTPTAWSRGLTAAWRRCAACCGRACWSTAWCCWRSRSWWRRASRCARRSKVDVVRDRSTLARIVDDGWVENVHRLQAMNATESPQRYVVRAEGCPGITIASAPPLELGPAQARWWWWRCAMPPQTRARPRRARSPSSSASPSWRERRAGRELEEKSTFVIPAERRPGSSITRRMPTSV